MATDKLIGCSRLHQSILRKLQRIATTDAGVLITGPTGVGKELYAHFVHRNSLRKNGKFVPVNCGGLSTDLLDNELFGHVNGAFTGASVQHNGLVAEAEGGTIFFDEVDSLSIPCQIKLLRFLQDKKYRRLGETSLQQANIRVIAATNKCLEAEVQCKRFRQDLFFRLRVVPVEIPPLCSRQDDIAELVDFFIDKYSQLFSLPPIKIGAQARERIACYNWPGNVRELENCIEYLTCLQLDREVGAEDLPLLKIPHFSHVEPDEDEQLEFDELNSVDSCLGGLQQAKKHLIIDFEKKYIHNVLTVTNGNVSAAARVCGKDRRVLFELMRKYRIDPAKYRIAPLK